MSMHLDVNSSCIAMEMAAIYSNLDAGPQKSFDPGLAAASGDGQW